MDNPSPRAIAEACVQAGIDAAHPQAVANQQLTVTNGTLRIASPTGTSRSYDLQAHDRVFVLGGGNAAGQLAAELEACLGDWLTDGVIVTDDPAGCEQITEHEGDHPIPSARGRRGAQAVRTLAQEASADDLVIAVITGGGSALLPAPADDIPLVALQAVTDALLAAGAPIDAINIVRKHCSTIKGGRLGETLAPATVAGIHLSDVVDDDLSTIASGPLVPDQSTFADAQAILDRYDVDPPAVIADHLAAGVAGERPETPDGSLSHVDPVVIATNMTALSAAAETATAHGCTPMILSSRIRGPAREAGSMHADIAAEAYRTGTPVSPPAVILSGGETTVHVAESAGNGTGGPNQEFVVAGVQELRELDITTSTIAVAAVDTDGFDGPTDAAGGVLTPAAVETEQARDALDRHDVTPFLADHEGLIETGSTGTNVNDLRAFVVT